MRNTVTSEFDWTSRGGEVGRASLICSSGLSEGYLIPLRSLLVSEGAVFGESLHSAKDFILGDALRLANGQVSIRVSQRRRAETGMLELLTQADVGRKKMTVQVVKSITLMSEHGQAIQAQIIQEKKHPVFETFVLLEASLASSIEYTLIDQQRDIPAIVIG